MQEQMQGEDIKNVLLEAMEQKPWIEIGHERTRLL